MANFLDQFTGNIQQSAADKATAGIRAGMTDYGQYADLGRNALQTNYTSALQPFQQLQQQGAGGYSAYADATGANGPEGLARANAQYQAATPGFAGAAQRAADLTARAGVAGGAGTGNIIDQIGRNSTQQGLDAYNKYVAQLAPWLQQGQQTAAGISGIYGNLGQGLAGSYGNQATAMLGAQTKIGDEQKQGELGQLTGLQNLTNFGMNLGKLAVGGMGGGFGGGGGLVNSVGGLFGNSQVGSPGMPSYAGPNGSYYAPNGMGGYSPMYGSS